MLDFLWQRRVSHLSILREDSWVTKLLVEAQGQLPHQHWIVDTPKCLCYVMSIHCLDNSEGGISAKNITLMTEPSILGITDDPKDYLESCAVDLDKFNCQITDNSFIEGIYTVRAKNTTFHVSWANVVAEISDPNNNDLSNLISQEIALQKLWYKIFLYTDNLSHPEKYIDAIDRHSLREIKNEILRTKIEYSNFIRVNATGATHLNLLKEKLIQTSKIEQIYKDFLARCHLLDDLYEANHHH